MSTSVVEAALGVVPEVGTRALFCLPHAGAGGSAYSGWGTRMGDWRVFPITLPGRERRLRERALDDIETATAQIREIIVESGVAEFALFGHSLGAILAYETAHRLCEGGHMPTHLFLSGCPAPEIFERRYSGGASADEATLLRIAKELGGTPARVLKHPEMRELVLRVLRADFEMAASYRSRSGMTLSVDASILGGRDDASTPEEDLARWTESLASPPSVRTFTGEHFYLFEGAAADEVTQYVAATLTS